jgi:hypothetical protein
MKSIYAKFAFATLVLVLPLTTFAMPKGKSQKTGSVKTIVRCTNEACNRQGESTVRFGGDDKPNRNQAANKSGNNAAANWKTAHKGLSEEEMKNHSRAEKERIDTLD